MNIDENITLLFDSLTSPETRVKFQAESRADADVIKSSINPSNGSPFELSTGASDADSYHDFFRLQIAFQDIWSELLDSKIMATGQMLYSVWDALMGDKLEDPKFFPNGPPDIRGETELIEFMDFLKGQFGISTSSSNSTPPPALLKQMANLLADTLDISLDNWDATRAVEQQAGGILFPTITLPDGKQVMYTDYVKSERAKAAALRLAAASNANSGGILANLLFSELDDLMKKLDAMLSEKYRFDVFAPNSINYGLILNYRQHWVPQSYQVGNLVTTIPLAPLEVRRYTTKTVVKKTRNVKEIDDAMRTNKDEMAETSRVDSEIVQRAKHQSNFQMNASESFGNDNLYKVSAGQQTGQDQAVESAQTKRDFHETVVRSSQEYRNEHRLEINTEESTETEDTSFREIRNPNDELTVTYLFYELQRRYMVDEKLHKVTPVILVANSVPSPDEVDQSWLLRHDWILRRTILDNSFLPALEYLSNSFTGTEINLKVFGLAVEDQRTVVNNISQQVQVSNDALNAAGLALVGAENQQIGDLKAQETASLVKSFFDPLGITSNGNADGNADRAAVDFAKDTLDRAQAKVLRLQNQLKIETTALQVAIDKFTKASGEHFSMLTAIDRLRVHIKDNIIYYMQAIWTYEPVDQRFFRLYNVDVPTFKHNTTVTASKAGGLSLIDTSRQTYQVNLPAPEYDGKLKLHQVADIENLMGFKGNYMIFPMVNFNYMTWFMMQDYLAVDENGVYARDPDELGGLTVDQLKAAMKDLYKTKGPAHFATMEPVFQQIMEQLLSKEQPEMVIVPSNSLYIEALPGTHPLLEDFKLIHRAVDVKKAQAETRHAELENLRLASRLENDERGDPDIDKMIVVAEGNNVNIDT